MADVFKRRDAYFLLHSKYIVFIGDSNIRAQYKDLVWLLKCDTLIDNRALRTKMEKSFMGDALVKNSELHRGRDFEECRSFKDKSAKIQIDFMFITRCYNKSIVTFLNDIKSGTRAAPEVIYINSCLWDLTRWGPNGVSEYKDNMIKLMKKFKECLPEHTLVVWSTALPISAKMNSSLLIKQLEFIKHFMRFEVMEANLFARDIVVNHGYDIVDNHFHMRMQIHRRAKDGVHFQPIPVRFMTNLMLTHLALSWDAPLPGRTSRIILARSVALEVQREEPEIQLLELPDDKSSVSNNITAGTSNNKKKTTRKNREKSPDYNNQAHTSQSVGPIKNRPKPRYRRYRKPYYV